MQPAHPEDEQSSPRPRLLLFLRQRMTDGSLPLLLGVALLVRALLTRKNRTSALVQMLTGLALLSVGIRLRRSQRGESSSEHDDAIYRDKTGTTAERVESHQPETNPRGTDEEPAVETETEPDEGTVRFSEEQIGGPQSEATLDEPDAGDPRHAGDDIVEVDLSEAAMADEASEAVGPTTAQSQPTDVGDSGPDGVEESETNTEIGGDGEMGEETEHLEEEMDEKSEAKSAEQSDGETNQEGDEP